ncbi:hypothetical protein PBY51_015501 [Eleginops maclovinus]|uniref:Uncharacterized protein n=1 Tax=Eleginops maclovinus TaxID=56733 RepID=A0AAN7X3V3_ELEMC|nr:hypothetical protein PBY51_015501 [Eleginops maclovinus]
MDFLGNLGGKTMNAAIGRKAGEVVEDLVVKVMGGDKEEDDGGDKGGAIDNLMKLGGGSKDEDKGFGLGDALSMVQGKDDKKDEGGANVIGALGKLF